MKKDIYIVDYIGNCNNVGQPLGHPTKIINEYTELLKDNVSIQGAFPNNYKSSIQQKNYNSILWLKHFCDVTSNNILVKIFNIFKKLINIWKVIGKTDNEILWFINMDFALGLFFSLYHNKNKTIWVTTYIQNYNGSKLKDKIKNYIFSNAIKRANLIISSNKNIKFSNKDIMYIPDYFYDDNMYSKYRNINKLNQVACVGTINNLKDIEGLINAFKYIDIPLKIVGHFYNKDEFKFLSEVKTDNIELIDTILDREEYYSEIGKAKYIILPYKQEYYENKTSGVLLETIFLNSIPIGPRFLLEYNQVNGICYDGIDDLISIFNHNIDEEKIIRTNNEKIEHDFNIKLIRENLIKVIELYK